MSISLPPSDDIVRPVQTSDAFTASPVAQALLDGGWTVIHANPAWLALTGAARGAAWMDLVETGDLASNLPALGGLQSGASATHRCQLRLRTADGRLVPSELILTAISDGREGILVTVLPGTPSAAPAGDAEDRRQLAAALSHDVRQHARLVSAYCSLIARGPLDERQRSQMAVVTDHAGRLQEILGVLVRWLRLADEPLDRQPCDLERLWAAATAGLAGDIVTGPLPTIVGDPTLLGEMLRELALNAVRYHPGRARIDLQATLADGAWVLDLSDDGAGIPGEHRAQVLLPLHRLHSWEQVHGTGMGLTLAARIALRHGGRLEIAESAGGGCRIRIHLPG